MAGVVVASGAVGRKRPGQRSPVRDELAVPVGCERRVGLSKPLPDGRPAIGRRQVGVLESDTQLGGVWNPLDHLRVRFQRSTRPRDQLVEMVVEVLDAPRVPGRFRFDGCALASYLELYHCVAPVWPLPHGAAQRLLYAW